MSEALFMTTIKTLLCSRSASLIQLDQSLASCSKLDRTNANDMFDRQDICGFDFYECDNKLRQVIKGPKPMICLTGKISVGDNGDG